MARQVVFPFDDAAGDAADEEFHALFPELEGEPIDPDNPMHRNYAKIWFDLYEKHGGKTKGHREPGPHIEDPLARCKKSWITFIVVDDATDRPIADVELYFRVPTNSGAFGRLAATDENGVVHFDDICYGFVRVEGPPPRPDLIEGTLTRTLGLTKIAEGRPVEEYPDAVLPPGSRSLMVFDVEVRSVGDGDSLKSVAADYPEFNGFQLGLYNIGWTPIDPEWVWAAREYLGAHDFADDGDVLFSDHSDPGIVFVPRQALFPPFEVEKVHEIRVSTIARRHRLELQTVDEFNIYAPDTDLVLKPLLDPPIEIKTNGKGYWSTADIMFGGEAEVVLPSGTKLELADKPAALSDKDGNRLPAVIDPLLSRSTISTVRIPTVGKDEAERRRNVAARYWSLSKTMFRPPRITPDGTETIRPFNNAVDNLWIAAGWKHTLWGTGPPIQGGLQGNDFDEMKSLLKAWFEDRIPTPVERGYFTMFLVGRSLRVYGSDGSKIKDFTLHADWEVKGQLGAYAPYERSGHPHPIYLDMARQLTTPGLFKTGSEYTDYAGLYELVEERADFRDLLNDEFGHVPILYILPSNYATWVSAARHGGAGILEDYVVGKHPDYDTVFERVHERNKSIIEGTTKAFNAYLEDYIEKVEAIATDKTKSQAEAAVEAQWTLRRLGPPHSPYHYALPGGLGFSKQEHREARLELAELNMETSSFWAWKAVAHKLDEIWNRPAPGSISFRAEFEPSASLEYFKGAKLRGGTAIGPRFVAGGGRTHFMKGKYICTADFDADTGSVRASTTPLIVEMGERDDLEFRAAVGGQFFRAEAVAAADVERRIEINTKTGENTSVLEGNLDIGFGMRGGGWTMINGAADFEQWRQTPGSTSQTNDFRNKFPEGKFVRIGFELGEDGSNRLDMHLLGLVGGTVKYNISKGDVFLGRCGKVGGPGGRFNAVLREAGISTEAEVCVGIYVKLIDEETVAVAFSNAPGFFERIDLAALLSTASSWNHLTEDVQHCLITLGWCMETWDRKHDDLTEDEWPPSIRLAFRDLPNGQKTAALHLGFRSASWPTMFQDKFPNAPKIEFESELIDAVLQSIDDDFGEGTGRDFYNGLNGYLGRKLPELP